MKNILIVLDQAKNVKPLITKAVAFNPERIALLCLGGDSVDLDPEEIAAGVNFNGEVSVIREEAEAKKDKAATTIAALKQGPWDLVALSRPLMGKDSSDSSLIKTVLKESAQSRVLLCGTKSWSSPVNLLATVDIVEGSQEQGSLNKKVLTEAFEVANLLGATVKALSVIPMSKISTELDVVEPSEVLEKKGPATHTKLESFVKTVDSSNGVEIHIAAGSPPAEINSVAKKLKSDLAVVGNVGRTGIQGLIVGNTAIKILSHLAVDALIVR